MAEVKFDDIRLFLCDPRVQVRSSLRMALNDAGMKNGNIWEGGDMDAITDAVSDPNGPDIVLSIAYSGPDRGARAQPQAICRNVRLHRPRPAFPR